MSGRYRLSRAARRDIDKIWDYSFENWGEEQADSYIGQFRAGLDRLNAGQLHPRDRADLRRGYTSYPVGSHLMLIRPTAGNFEVVRILHQSMDVDRYLK